MAGLDGCGKLDISAMSPDNIVAIGNKVWIKAQVEEKIWIYQNRPCTVIKLEEACIAGICDDAAPLPKALIGSVDNSHIVSGTSGGESSDSDRKAKSVSEEVTSKKDELEVANTAVDIRSINNRGFQGMAVIPSAAVIPMRSNTKTYGPYASSNFGSSCGGTQVEVNTDLCPWVFGSIAGMNGAGQTLVESSAIGLTKAETGGITIPGLPISAFTELGAVLGSGGATLSGMNFSYGSGGISTSYEFKTYTPKFGGLNRHLIDRIKDISRNRTEQLRFLRNQQSNLRKVGRKIERFNKAFPKNGNRNDAANNQPSLQRILIGEIYNWQKDGQRTVIGVDTINDSVSEMVYDFQKKAYISWDHFFGPVSKKGDGSLPRYTTFSVDCHKASPECPNPPFAIASGNSEPFANGLDQYNLEITQQYLDPLTNNVTSDSHHHEGDGRGHVTDIVGRKTEVPQQGLITNFYHLDDSERYSEDYRFLAMRGPILLHSWGYDTQGKPIPNYTDIEDDVKKGEFKNENLKDKFFTDWLGKPATWPVAPIDFRFDRKRGVWVTPPGYKVVVAELKEKLDQYGTAEAQLINKDTENNLEFGPKLFNANGEEVKATDEDDSEAIIKVVDRLGIKYNAGTKVYCYYDTFKCEYIIIQAAPKQTVRFRLIDICQGTPVEPDYGDEWTKHAGYGDKFPNNHILGIRINCEGDTVDNKGEFITHDDIVNPEKANDIFINLFDTCGQFGSAYAYYNVNAGVAGYNEWKRQAATGFAVMCDPASENTCALGEGATQCSTINEEYDSYDIVFLDGYARFIECELTQKLYVSSQQAAQDYPNDEYKQTDPEGNAAATILHFYGDPGNGSEPKFYKNDTGGLKEIEFRVFDPFEGAKNNPFASLDYGDRVLAVFDENRKKYVIYNSLQKYDKLIKFALVDNKDIGDRIARAVLVDIEGYPIDEAGSRLNASNFSDNFITVFDSFAIHGYADPPKYHNFGTTGFGPALGSDNFNEHMNGIPLNGAGDQSPPNLQGSSVSTWTGGPFIGYALSRPMPGGVSSDLAEYETANEIIFLETFAQAIRGKIASTYPEVESEYYLGALNVDQGTGGFINGRIPFTRYALAENNKLNLRVRYPLDQHLAGKYITGDIVDNPTSGDIFSSVDGCNFVAVLDPVTSKVNTEDNSEKLYYVITEVENIANRGRTVLTKKEKSDELNAGSIKESKDESTGVVSEYMDGFMWDKDKSQKHYEKTTILNRDDWVGRALLTKYRNEEKKHIRTVLEAYDEVNGVMVYRVEDAGTIAEVAEGKVGVTKPGKFGHPNGLQRDDMSVKKLSDPLFYQGFAPISPDLDLQDQDMPTLKVTHNWMTYYESPIVGMWNDISNTKIQDANYNVIYAREAPIIVTGTAAGDFEPFKEAQINVIVPGNEYSSCPGYDKEPVKTLLTRASNPMGHGAQRGDLVTLQRVFSPVLLGDVNYYYIVIGTGSPPGT